MTLQDNLTAATKFQRDTINLLAVQKGTSNLFQQKSCNTQKQSQDLITPDEQISPHTFIEPERLSF